LNHEVFTREIPQHEPRPDGVLVDPFHDENSYVIAVRNDRVVGMVCYRGRRPFSLDRKLPDLDRFLTIDDTVCEVRLLAVRPEERHGVVLRGLISTLADNAIADGFRTAIISGTVTQRALYQHLGFEPFGPIVGTTDAAFQPMKISLHDLAENDHLFPQLAQFKVDRQQRLFQPGPVALHEEVKKAHARPLISHRSEEFRQLLKDVQRLLCHRTRAKKVMLAVGSGTLANDMVAMQIAGWNGRGVVLSNGAFGERLVDHARRCQLDHIVLRSEWGEPIDHDALRSVIEQDASITWIWFVHGETSTGVLNDIEMVRDAISGRDMRICLDAISTLGNVPVHLEHIALASAVSGKGLASVAGLSMVFANVPFVDGRHIPRYLDLSLYEASDAIPFTIGSPLLSALHQSLLITDPIIQINKIAQLNQLLRYELADLNDLLIARRSPAPFILSIAMPPDLSSVAFGDALDRDGWSVSYRSTYLIERNWIQVALMGQVNESDVRALAAELKRRLR
jgi:aspartate aminotransferase-like enzyme